MYGSIDAVKDNLPRFSKNIKEDTQATDALDISYSVVEGYLEEFSGVVDAALSKLYSVPFSSAPAIINKIVSDLASYKLARRFWTNISNEDNQSLLALRKDAKELLNSISSGDYDLPGSSKRDLDDLSGIESDDVSVFDMEDESTWQDKL